MSAVDKRGVKLEVGQTVAYSDLYSSVEVAKIAKITPKMVELDDKSRWDDFGTRRHHHAVLIVEPFEVTQ